MATGIPPLPPNLKAIQHYLKTANEHDKRDPVVAYYCRLYAMQKGMEIDKKSPDCRTFLVSLMDFLEKVKQDSSEEAITNEVVGQAHVENYALKVFLFADNEDRASRFNKNVVKSFYTSGMLFDILSVFGEMGEDIEKNRKYAKWKAAYIHKCLKNGETPVAGPMQEEGEEGEFGAGAPQPGYIPSSQDLASFGGPSSQQPASYPPPSGPSSSGHQNLDLPTPNSQYPPSGGHHAPPTTPQDMASVPQQPPSQPQVAAAAYPEWRPPSNSGGCKLTPEQYHKTLKYCKYASSAIQYEDSPTAIANLTKALKLLTTGIDS